MTRRFMLIAGASVCLLTGAAFVTSSSDAANSVRHDHALLSDDAGDMFEATQVQEQEKKKPGDFKKGKGFPDFKKMMGKGPRGADFKKKMMSYKGKMGGKGFPDFKKKGKGFPGFPDFKKKKKDDDAVGEVGYPVVFGTRVRHAEFLFLPTGHHKV